MPIELSLGSWSIVDWEGEVHSREDLLLARMRQLDQRVLDEVQAAENLENARKANKAYFDQSKCLQDSLTLSIQLQVSDLVLLYNIQIERSRFQKLDDNWRGPYRIREGPGDSTYYRLEELDGVPLATSFAGNRLKKFFSRRQLDQNREMLHSTIRVRNELEDTVDESADEGEEAMENMDVLSGSGVIRLLK